jgi:hypothetical protein
MRVEPWMPPGAAAPWKKGLAHLARVANTAPATAPELARAIDEKGSVASSRLEAKDELLGRCVNYAGLTLATAIEAAAHDVSPVLTKTIIDAAKYSASIGALHAHAGRVRASGGKHPVDVACEAIWGAIRADIAALAAAPAKLDARALRALAPLWPGRVPAWATR